MSRFYYNLPPLTALAAFEAAARHLSFKNAAQELSVTPGAVSHQVKALERNLGAKLFDRRHRSVELTDHGRDLFETLSSSFSQISGKLAKIQLVGDPEVVTVGSTTAVAALWLSPAIIEFWRDHPEINVHQITQDRPFQNQRELDFFIRYGKDTDTKLAQTELYRDQLVPVATPEFAREHADSSLQELAQMRLVHLNAGTQSWTSWSDWFAQLGYSGDIAVGTRVTTYSVALQIARQGAGVALGWKRLVQPMLSSGKLAVVGSHTLPAPHRFFLAGSPDQDLSPSAKKLKSWILAQSRASSV